MSNENPSGRKVHEAIKSGKLPDRRPTRMWGGQGSGASCPLCGETSKPWDVEVELEFTREDGETEMYCVHSRCFAAWDLERCGSTK